MNLQNWFGVSRIAELHCHCLPDVDDGPRSWDESLELCRVMAMQGVTDVVATPHQLGLYDGQNAPQLVRQRVGELNALLARERVALKVYPGGDVRIDERIPELLDSDAVLTIGDAGHYILLELFTRIAVDPQPLLMMLLERGVVPIVSHPERYPWLARRTDSIARWLEEGVGVQVTAGALTGDFGPAVHSAAWNIVRLPGLMLVASDAHDTVRRPPRLLQAAQLIVQQLGWQWARNVCIDGPLRLVQAIGVPES